MRIGHTADQIVADPVGVVRDVARLATERRTRYDIPEGSMGWEYDRFAATPRRRPTEISRPKIARSYSTAPISTMTSKRNSVSAILSTSNDLPDLGHL